MRLPRWLRKSMPSLLIAPIATGTNKYDWASDVHVYLCSFSFRLPPLVPRLVSGTCRARKTGLVWRSLWRPTWRTFLVSTAAVWHHQVASHQFWAGLTALLTPECLPFPSLATPGRSGCDASKSDRCPLCTTDHSVLLRQRTLREALMIAHMLAPSRRPTAMWMAR